MSEDLKTLSRKRGNIKRRLTSFANYVDNCTASDTVSAEHLSEIKLRLGNISTILEEFSKVQDAIEVLVEDSDLDQHYKYSEEFENLYFSYVNKAKMLETIRPHSNTSTAQSEQVTPIQDAHDSEPTAIDAPNTKNISHSSENPSTENRSNESANLITNNDNNENLIPTNSLRLPTVDLPKFSGHYHSWLEFKDTFESLVHNNDKIPPILKFHYLRSSLTGSASQHIQTVEFSAANYNTAWSGLLERYDNRRLLVHNHVKALFELSSMKKDTYFHIRQLLDKASKHLQSLKSLGEPIEYWDTLIIFIVCNKLDENTAREWEHRKGSIENVTLNDLYKFLKVKADELEALSMRDSVAAKKPMPQKGYHVSTGGKQLKCFNCSRSHGIYACPEFQQMSVTSRIKRVAELNLCKNCLGKHPVSSCKSRFCKFCDQPHNSLLHIQSTSENKDLSNHASHGSQVLLSTACVAIIHPSGTQTQVRALLDSGSQSHFISEGLFERLGIPHIPIHSSVVGISGAEIQINKRCTIRIKSANSQFTKNISCYILPEITEPIPTSYVDVSNLEIPITVQLADPAFNEPGNVDLLLGAGIFWDLLREGKRKIPNSHLILYDTALGWVISGIIPDSSTKNVSHFSRHVEDVQDQIERFWKIEEIQSQDALSLEERICEDFFAETTSRDETGKFIVRLPLKNNRSVLGDSKKIALKRFQGLERKLSSNSELKRRYIDFMQEYEDLGHMEKIMPENLPPDTFFLPHHGVLKESSQSTKLRTVFDGSAKSSSGLSLNDIQLVGPTVQEELLSILLRFRKHKFIVGADVKMMYRQVWIHPEDRPLQLIFWRSDPTKELNTYMLKTVTYGMASSPYLATRCLKQVALESAHENPLASRTIQEDFYIDDLLTGHDSASELIRICHDVKSILANSGFPLHKWVSNVPAALTSLSTDGPTGNNHLLPGSSTPSKILGLRWFNQIDQLGFSIPAIDSESIDTKRKLLSDIAQIWDPLGLVSPCVLFAKITLQHLWQLKISWDDAIPDSLRKEYIMYKSQLSYVNHFRIPRRVLVDIPLQVQLHGFADASQRAYGACIYLRSVGDDGDIRTYLLCSRSRVAPLKVQTIPRLELCAALLLAELVKKVSSALKLNFNDTFLWTDSSIVLHWINTTATKLQVFVSNRVAKIQTLTEIEQWHHVHSEQNPADILSRGTTGKELMNNEKWWHGPAWLIKSENHWPASKLEWNHEPPELRKAARSITLANSVSESLFSRFSSLSKLRRVTAYMQRFLDNCRRPKDNRRLGPLDTIELTSAINTLTKLSQRESFHQELTILKKNNHERIKGSIKYLNPFVDTEGILRVGGRKQNAPLPYQQKHQAVLSSKHIFTKLIFQEYHLKFLHAPPQLLLASVRDLFWPLGGRSLARSTVHKCITCFKAKPSTITPQMGTLPKQRLKPSLPFTVTGTDFAGPFTIRDRKGRNCKHIKCYVCLFICFSTKAIHLEAVTDLSTEGFMSCFKRFCARRGKPAEIFSDNGSNYIGAKNELRRLYEALQAEKSSVYDQCAEEGISWHLIPPQSPHFGGLWEAGVKTVKYHLKRVMGNNVFTYENFYTLLTQVEAVVNSRPLCPISSDPSDFDVLTPSHLLVGRKLLATPDPDYSYVRVNRLSSYQHIQALQRHFWKRWSKEYVHELQVRHKWFHNQASLKVGTLVLIKEDNLPVFSWKLGRVIKVFPGVDNVSRVALIQTRNGLVKRSFSKLCPLPMNTDP